MFQKRFQLAFCTVFSLLLLTVPAWLCTPPLCAQAADRLQETGEKIVIVIDPGHGGENRGTIENGHEEKFMTMTTAQAMYDELCLYDNVEVYLTRTDDVDVLIKDRAQFAAEKDADFLFSLHYNASEYHELFGTEVWVSAFAPYNGYGYQFGYEFLTAMQEKGLFVRGIKTRLGDKGADYYGIIRESVALGVPAVIVEHCHVDEERDEGYCATEEQLQEFGRADATAVAKYFGLKSSALGVDYAAYPLADAEASTAVPATLKDETEPDICELSFADADYAAGTLSLTVRAADYDSPLLYYDYSLDGGETFSRREIWPDSDALTGTYADTFTLNLQIPSGTTPAVVVRAYNLFDLFSESNCYQSAEVFKIAETAEAESAAAPTLPPASQTQEAKSAEPALSGQVQEEEEVSLLTFLEICLIAVVLLFVLLLISQGIAYHRKRKSRRQRRNDAGERRNHPR